LLPYRMEGNVKVFDLRTSVIRWTLLPGVTVDAYAYNGQIPGPRIHIHQGDRVRVNVTNGLPEDTTVHWARDHSAKSDGWTSRDHPTGNPAQRDLQLRVHSPEVRHLTGRRGLVFMAR
jgi:FtsP/CotA-like multicopper oxidase with cupredoxin domain